MQESHHRRFNIKILRILGDLVDGITCPIVDLVLSGLRDDKFLASREKLGKLRTVRTSTRTVHISYN